MLPQGAPQWQPQVRASASSSACISLSRLAQALPTARGHLLSVSSPRAALTSGCLPSVSSRESPSFLPGCSSQRLPRDRTCPQPSGQGMWGHTAHLSSDQQGLSSWAGHTQRCTGSVLLFRSQVTVLEFLVIFAPPHFHSAPGPETFIVALLTWRCHPLPPRYV